jgi:hypothetical protein
MRAAPVTDGSAHTRLEVRMVPLTSLWLPILLSAVFVFVASSIIHMVLPIHRNDLRKVQDEDGVMDALRRFNLAPGDYALPHAGSPEGMKSPAFLDKMNRGPVAFMTVAPAGPPAMAKALVLWFLYSIVVAVFAGYVGGRALAPGARYPEVFRFAGTTAFAGYSLALLQNSIWWRRNWSMTLKSMVDGLFYAMLTAGTFGWLWPR